jgi:hypothetical protein
MAQNPGTRQEYLAAHPDAWEGNGTDYMSAIRAYYGENPGSFEDWSYGKGAGSGKYAGQIIDEATIAQELQSDYQKALDLYNQGQSYLAAQAPQTGQSYTEEQIVQMTGSPLNEFSTYQGIPVATSYNPFAAPDAQGWSQQYQFIKNPDGTYRTANLGGPNPDVRVNAPKGTGWDDYMNMAITAATIAGNAYVAPQAIGAAFAPAEGAALAGPTYAELGYTGLPEGAAGPTYAEMGYTGLNNQQSIAAADAASNAASIREGLNTANNLKKVYNLGDTLSKLLTGGASGTSGTSGGGGTSQQQVANYLRGITSPVQTNDYLGQIKMNQNPFLFTSPGQTLASEGMYDVSGSNAMANALRKA